MNVYQELQRTATQIRRDVLRMVHGAGSGHPGGALGCADLFTLLYFKVMKHNPDFQMKGKDEDLFFLSNGHIGAVWYSTLARAGYFPVPELSTHRKIDSRLQGHPTPYEHLEGVRMASGSLGQGLSVACGAALSKRLDNDPRFVYVLMGDGEQQEGQIWEAAMFAAHHKLDHLIAFVDWNGQQIDGPVDEVMSLGDLVAKYQAFGWTTLTCNGNNLSELDGTISKAHAASGKGKPIVILMETVMSFPIDFMMGDHKWHGVAPNDDQLAKALAQLEETLGDY